MTKDELIKRYKEVHKEKTGEDITNVEALDQALNLVSLVKAVYQPKKYTANMISCVNESRRT
ncbi:hypothetical protein KC850_03645 [Candidatus Kaiserbacteria bacterium]|nr:hypothetical protein [Candidatus Kaiserbacteria bacterium]MCB9818431.1 hypothetical protein [Candidatus Nomurabacteria bacterium]